MSWQSVGHFLIAGHFWYGCYYDWYHVKIPSSIVDLGDSKFNTHKLKYLTYWDALIQSIFFTICLLNDLVGTNEQFPKRKPLIRHFKDALLPILAFPLSMFVGLTFWGLYALDRELIFPKVLDQYFPAWLNQLMHTNIMIFSFLELLISYRKYPSRKTGLTILLAFMLIYLTWIHYVHSYTNKWVYPILEVMNFPMRIGFFIVMALFIVAMYIMGETINRFWWERKSTNKSKKLKQ
ncbi:unnamed protein product [Ceutorhynchus assimilis]|uniref:Uncharacterized protein n=1 Tax=Ceutorhynchus assimilis TaxID=467358 RepID=A0A9N9MIP0_9CUCU|nr:unnamed protein product [Ceutorhynchus assimilis]